MHNKIIVGVLTVTLVLVLGATALAQIGREVAIQTHLSDGQEFQVSTRSHKLWQESVHGGVDEPGGRGTSAH